MGVVIVVLLLFGAAAGWRIRDGRRRRSAARDDTARAGQDADISPNAAARRAVGKTSWMRIGGGGV